jgi:hypothetical protein
MIRRLSIRQCWWVFLGLLAISGGFLAVLSRYGTTFPFPLAPDEDFFIQAAHRLAHGESLRAQRFYGPLQSTVIALSLWGRAVGFEHLEGMRWFNRLLGVVAIWLLFALARLWGIPPPFAFLACLWTSLDIFFQLTSNIVRGDLLCLVLALLTLTFFTMAWTERHQGKLFLAGLFGVLALSAHGYLPAGMIALLSVTAILQFRKRAWLWFLPFLIGVSLWLGYAAGDWATMAFKLRRIASDFHIFLGIAALLAKPLCATFSPNNAPLWVAVGGAVWLARRQRLLNLAGWQIGAIGMAYLLAMLRPHDWYAGWFAPLGYLLTAALVASLFSALNHRDKAILLCLVFLWLGYQTMRVAQYWQAKPQIARKHQRFFAELATMLPPKGVVALHAWPDPIFYLRRHRPDLRLHEWPGLLALTPSSARFFRQMDALVLFETELKMMEQKGVLPRYRVRRRWAVPLAPGGGLWLCLAEVQRTPERR